MMGRSSSFICHTCKKEYYLGYASYSSWLDMVYSLKEYEKAAEILTEKYSSNIYNWHDRDGPCIPPDPRHYRCNRNVKYCLEKCKDHKFEYHSEDFDSPESGYEFIDLEEV